MRGRRKKGDGVVGVQDTVYPHVKAFLWDTVICTIKSKNKTKINNIKISYSERTTKEQELSKMPSLDAGQDVTRNLEEMLLYF